MYRVLFCLVAAVLLCAPVGCRSCAHPFDYCGPTFTGAGCGECGDGGGACDPNSRAGSILVSGAQSVPGDLSPEPAPERAPLISPERSDHQDRLEESMLPSSGVQLIAEQGEAKTPILKPTKSSSKRGWMARKSGNRYR